MDIVLGHGSGAWMFKAAREICTISYEVNECMKHMLLKRYTTASRLTLIIILQLVPFDQDSNLH